MPTPAQTITLRDGRTVRRLTMLEIASEYAAIRAECPCLIREDRLASAAPERRREQRR
jgi:hypothetical protein